METDQVADMTLDELRGFISEIVSEKLKQERKREDNRSLEEVLATMDRLRWTPPPTAPTNLEMLREDRDN